MLPGKYKLQITACGVTVEGDVALSATSGIEPVDRTLPAGHAGTLATATIAMVAGHGLLDGTFDVHGVGWCRYGCAIDFTGDNGAVTGGAGDALADGPVVVTAAVSLDVTFDGDNAVLVGVSSSEQTHVRFVDSNGAVIGSGKSLLLAGGAWGWAFGIAANPLSGNAVAAVLASNGSAANPANLKLTGLQHAT
jgi:hypothetical protein